MVNQLQKPRKNWAQPKKQDQKPLRIEPNFNATVIIILFIVLIQQLHAHGYYFNVAIEGFLIANGMPVIAIVTLANTLKLVKSFKQKIHFGPRHYFVLIVTALVCAFSLFITPYAYITGNNLTALFGMPLMILAILVIIFAISFILG